MNSSASGVAISGRRDARSVRRCQEQVFDRLYVPARLFFQSHRKTESPVAFVDLPGVLARYY